MQCISIDWHLETSTFMLYAASSPRKATNWSGIKNDKSSKETRLPWYQSVDEKHIWVYVKFEVGLSIPFARKMGFKKVRLFQGLSFLQKAGFEHENLSCELLTSIFFFLKELLISQNRDREPTIKFYMQHYTMYIYRLIPRNKHIYAVCCE
jgi:hypothetical protein